MTAGSIIRSIRLRQKEPEDVSDEGGNNSVLDGGGGGDCTLEEKTELVSFSVVLYD